MAARKKVGSGDKHYRSVIKAFSWRATGTLDTIVVSYIVTRQLSFALSIGAVELFTKIALYYVHERLWERIPLGRAKAPAINYDI